MDRELSERFERLVSRIYDDVSPRINRPWARHEIEWCVDRLERWVARGARWPLVEEFGVDPGERLSRLESKIEELLRRPTRCNVAPDVGLSLPNFMTSLTAETASESDLGAAPRRFRTHQAAWLANTKRCVIVDKYIFRRGDEALDKYVEGLADIVGESARRVDFYFSARSQHYDLAVAKAVEAKLHESFIGYPPVRQLCFYACSNLHDRIWLRHRSIADNPPYEEWEARVVGASLNGIKQRPTYIVDMSEQDANDFAKYLRNIRDQPSTQLTTSPPDATV